MLPGHGLCGNFGNQLRPLTPRQPVPVRMVLSRFPFSPVPPLLPTVASRMPGIRTGKLHQFRSFPFHRTARPLCALHVIPRVQPAVMRCKLHHDMRMVVAASRQPMPHRQPSDAFIVGIHTHSRQIITDDILPLLIGMDSLSRLDGQRAMPHSVLAFTMFWILRAPPVTRHRLPCSGTRHVQPVEPSANLGIRFTWLPVEVERIQ
ncbi:hypothetical protein PG2009B_0903 [Bifidobacterium pseudolongum subsp. globosum]|nr:hypothetical protein PG2009B_0903 [Bifidobacterium pseudolongum subsp. globosum]